VARRITVDAERGLDEAAEFAHLVAPVEELRQDARQVARSLRGRTLWMISSTAQGGGVSEMLPGMITHLRELGIATEWAVMESSDEGFFQLTKRIHNLMHGDGEPGLGDADQSLYETVNRANADALLQHVRDGDILAVHDPQPMPLAALLGEQRDLVALWRCHIGLDTTNEQTRDAWRFLERWSHAYQHAIFSAPEYVAPYFEGCSSIIYPALDPLTAKNRPLRVQQVVSILERGGLLRHSGERSLPQFRQVAQRLQPDGSWRSACDPDDVGLLTRPIITQVSRWDRLKGFLPLMHGFAGFRRQLAEEPLDDELVQRRLGMTRLVLAGPDPSSIADDPEGGAVLDELRRHYMALDGEVQKDVALLALPMADLHENALLVNALQRVSTVIVQNSLREGFGLTITEAMWKGVPVLSNSHACGPRQQVRDGVDGRLIADPGDAEQIARALRSMLRDPARLERWGRSAERHVHDHFLTYGQLSHWLRLLGRLTGQGS
jgi:trehalose synthase